jgi:glycogen synthase
MRILITTDVVGGVWQFTQELAEGFLRDGSAVALVSLGGDPAPGQRQQCARLETQHGCTNFLYEHADIPLEWMPENESAYHDAAPFLLRIARDFEADILHANQFCFGALPLNIPKAVTAHSDVLSWAEACREEPLAPSPWLAQYRLLVADGLDGANLVIAPTRWMLSALKRNFAVRSPSAVIYNGRTLPDPGNAPRQLRAITAGRLWDEAKDVGLLAGVSSPVPLSIAGETQHRGASAPHNLGEVTLLGRLPEPALLEFFRESAIYICTSRYEPFGLAPLEAALCGCAVVARDIPSLREVWLDGARYFSDAQSLSALLEEYAQDPDALSAAKHRSLRRAECFTAEQMIASYRAEFTRTLRSAEDRAHAA